MAILIQNVVNEETFTEYFSEYYLVYINTTLLAERFFLVSPLACTMSFACLVFRVAGLFTLGDVNKPATRNTRHANDSVHAKGLARKKRSASRVHQHATFLVKVDRICLQDVKKKLLFSSETISFHVNFFGKAPPTSRQKARKTS